MTHETRLQKLETALKPQTRPTFDYGPGLHSPERLQRVLDAIAKHEVEHGPLPPVDWNEPCCNPKLEAIRVKVLRERTSKTS